MDRVNKLAGSVSLKAFIAGSFVLFVSGMSIGQAVEKPVRSSQQAYRASPAFAEVLLRETELKAELEAVLADYTDEHPRVKELKGELELLQSEMDRLISVKPSDAAKLTAALGKLMLRKVEQQTKLRQLRQQYADEHPNVRKQRKIVEVYEAAIKEILG